MSSVSAISLEAIAPIAGFKNKIINGDFSIWQRGIAFSDTAVPGATADPIYAADRWQIYSNIKSTAGNWTYSVSRLGFTIGSLGIANEPLYYIHVENTGASSGGDPNGASAGIRQYIENVREVGPGSVSVSCYLKGTPENGTTGSININLIQNLGTGGAPSANVVYTNRIDGLSTAWQRIESTFVLANLTSKTVGSDPIGYTSLEFEIQSDSVLGGDRMTDLDIANVQIENDNNATLFESRGPSLEWQLCQRYYQEIQAEWVGRFALNGWSWPAVANFPAVMRSVPLVVKAEDITAGRLGTIAATDQASGGSARGLRGFSGGQTGDVVGLSNNRAEINRLGIGPGVHVDPGYWNTIYGFDADYKASDG